MLLRAEQHNGRSRRPVVREVDIDLDTVIVVIGLIFWVPLMLLWYAQGSPYARKRDRDRAR
jgi:hypothetical protein